jgi:3-oxoacyl-[acyl-carrier-protein] synthase III
MNGGLAITGLGVAAPERVVTNIDLEATLDTSDEWIRARSGIVERRWVSGSESTTSLASEAVVAALKAAGRTPADVGLLIVATCTPDQAMPPTAAAVADAVGVRAGSFDLNGACAGFVEALVAGAGLVSTAPGPIVVVGAERMSSIVDPADRGTAVLFGDGAGAAVLEPGDGALLGWNAGSDGSLRSILEIPAGETYIKMDGGEVFRRAVRIVCDSTLAALDRAGLTPGDVDLFVPHQANVRIIEAVRTRLKLEPEQVVVDLDRWGNTSAASIAIALAEAAEADRLRAGSHLLVSGFGAGMTWSSAVVRWA